MAALTRLNKILNHLDEINDQNVDTISVQLTSQRSINEIEQKWKDLVAQDGYFGVSSWCQLKQKDLDTFSDLTYDHNWIHKEGAGKKGSPFGDTIAHGLLTLSMLPRFVYEVSAKYGDQMSLKQIRSGVNYGFDKVRFIGPVFVDNKIRAKFKLKSAEKGKKKNSIKYIYEVTVETKNKNTGDISDVLYAEWCGMTLYRV